MRIQNRVAKTTKCKMLPMVYVCLLGSENSEFRVWCVLLTKSNVMGTPRLGKSLKIFLV